MDATSISTLLAAVGALVVSVWSILKKTKVEEKKAESEIDITAKQKESELAVAKLKTESELAAAQNQQAIAEWRDYARALNSANRESIKALEQRHGIQIQALQEQNNRQEAKITKLEEVERKCQTDHARAMAEIEFLKRELARLTEQEKGGAGG
jgi:hypothetical protein